MRVLLNLKADYKTLTGVEWKPAFVVPPETTAMLLSGGDAEVLKHKCEVQGLKVRQLKSDKADKVIANSCQLLES